MAKRRGSELLQIWLEREQRSQSWLARQLGVTQMTVSRWVGGDSPKLDAALEIERITGVSVKDWTEWSEGMP